MICPNLLFHLAKTNTKSKRGKRKQLYKRRFEMLGGGERKKSGKKTNGKKPKSDDRARKFCRALLFDLLTTTIPQNEDMVTPDEQQEAIKNFGRRNKFTQNINICSHLSHPHHQTKSWRNWLLNFSQYINYWRLSLMESSRRDKKTFDWNWFPLMFWGSEISLKTWRTSWRRN